MGPIKKSSKNILLIVFTLLLGFALLVGCSNQPASQTEDPTPAVGENGSETIDLNNKTLEGFPPPIPHALEGMENCESCHKDGVGGAPKTDHPELSVCRQCHV